MDNGVRCSGLPMEVVRPDLLSAKQEVGSLYKQNKDLFELALATHLATNPGWETRDQDTEITFIEPLWITGPVPATGEERPEFQRLAWTYRKPTNFVVLRSSLRALGFCITQLENGAQEHVVFLKTINLANSLASDIQWPSLLDRVCNWLNSLRM